MGIRKDCKNFKIQIFESEKLLYSKLSILFCGINSYQKIDLQSEAKKAGFKPFYMNASLRLKKKYF